HQALLFALRTIAWTAKDALTSAWIVRHQARRFEEFPNVVVERAEALAERLHASDGAFPVDSHRFAGMPVIAFPARLRPCALLRQQAQREPLFGVTDQSASWIAANLAAEVHSEFRSAVNGGNANRPRIAVSANALADFRSRSGRLVFPDAV